jgi:hypothetical protein
MDFIWSLRLAPRSAANDDLKVSLHEACGGTMTTFMQMLPYSVWDFRVRGVLEKCKRRPIGRRFYIQTWLGYIFALLNTNHAFNVRLAGRVFILQQTVQLCKNLLRHNTITDQVAIRLRMTLRMSRSCRHP